MPQGLAKIAKICTMKLKSICAVVAIFCFVIFLLCDGNELKEVWWSSWWRHQMETFSALLAICAGNSPATGEFPAQKPVPPSFDVFLYLCLNKRFSKQSRGWWFEAPSCSLRRHCNVQSGFYQGMCNSIRDGKSIWWTAGSKLPWQFGKPSLDFFAQCLRGNAMQTSYENRWRNTYIEYNATKRNRMIL